MTQNKMKATCPKCHSDCWEVRLFAQGLHTTCYTCGLVVCTTIENLAKAAALIDAKPGAISNKGIATFIKNNN